MHQLRFLVNFKVIVMTFQFNAAVIEFLATWGPADQAVNVNVHIVALQRHVCVCLMHVLEVDI